MTDVLFKKDRELGDISQTEEDKEFGIADLRNGLRDGIYVEVASGYGNRRKDFGLLIYSDFTMWCGKGPNRKRRFVITLHVQSKNWRGGSVRMKMLLSLDLDAQKGHLLM